jgi:subtilisin-like proprotein convertase family protein
VGQTFATITEAVNSYNTNTCLSGPVTFLLTDALYSTSETFPIVINNNPLANATATLTIKPATGVSATVTSSASATAVFKLLNAQYITIDGVNTGGRSLTLNNSNTGTSAIIWLASTATTGPGNKNISLLNTNMNGGLSTSVSNWGILAGVDGATPANTNGMDNDSITVQGNYIKRCGYALWLGGTAATAAGGLNGWVIRNNILGPTVYNTTENLGVNGLFMRNMTNVIYSGNTLQNVGYAATTLGIAAMYMEAGIDGIVLDSNIVDSVLTNATGAPAAWAYYLGGGVKNATISRNKISSVYSLNTGGAGSRGIQVTNATAASNVNIVNNFISDVVSYSSTTVGNWPIGISVDGTSGGINIYNNSINLYGSHPGLTSATGSADIYVSTSGTGMDVRNNLLVNSYENTSSTTDKTYAIYSSSPISVYANIDYNNYYTTGGTGILGYIGTDRPTLTDMITGFGGNTHSINEAAPFVSGMDLHIPAGTTTPLESAGIAIAGLTTDIDNQVRPGPAGSTYGGGYNPDMGADEFDCVPIDGTSPLISYTALTTSTCGTGDRTLTGVTISDFSGVPTTGALMPRIYFKKNTGSWYSTVGTLASGIATNGTWNFTISAATMGGLVATDVVYYYIIAQDVATIPNLSAYPGVGFVATDVNTVTTAPTTPYTYTVIPTLSGSYTVGSGGAYTTLTAAVNAYNTACLGGNVTFLLTDASYSTGETFPIVIRSNPNASSSATLTIKPQTGVAATITSATGTASVIKLLNAQYVTIDGLNTGASSLALNNSNTGTNSAVVWLASTVTTGPGNNHITLSNMDMTGGTNSTNLSWGIIAGVDGTTPSLANGRDNDSITIQGNSIKRCGYAVVAAGTAATAAGGLDGWLVKNNTFGPSAYSTTDNLSYNGMFMRNMTNPVLSGNTIRNVGTTTMAAQSVGVYMEAGVDGAVLDSNIISSVQGSFAGGANTSVVGIYLGGSVINATISRNKISSIYNLHTSGYGARGITVNTGTTASNAKIVNNFISDVVSYSFATPANWPVGIGLDGASCGGVSIYHNSVNLFGSHPGLTSATGSTDIFINAGGGNFDVRDNLLVNAYENTSSTTDKTYAIYSSAANTVFSNIDYNDYYTSGGIAMLGYIAGADRPALTDMITGFGGNTHSISNSALFMTSTDLHLQAFSTNMPLIAGTPLTAVPADIDGVSRNPTTPLIGADEVNIPPCSGAPTPGIVTATVLSSCGNFNSGLAVVGSSLGSGLELQWQSSPDSSTWTNISGETDLTYNPTVTTTTYYRATIACTISSLGDVTPGFKLVSHPYPAITGSSTTCAGGSITLSATPAGGTWISAATSIVTLDPTTGIATGAAVGTAPITYTSAAGCATTSVVAVVSAPSTPVITPSTAVICEGGSVSMTAVSVYSTMASVTSGAITIAVPDGAVAGNYSSLSVALPPGATITSASVNINATMTYDGDWAINLTGPNGNTLNLFNRHGGGGQNFVNTVVSSTGSTTFVSSAPPYTGTYAATAATGSIGTTAYPVNVSTWAGLFGTPGGTWTLSVRDFLGGFAGTLTSWGITLNYSLPSDITWSPAGTLYTSADLSTPYTGTITSSIYGKPSAPGTVATVNTYTATASVAGCGVTNQSTAVVTVNPLPSPIVGADSVCHGLITTLSNPDAGGTWISSNTTAATIGSASGEVVGVSPGLSTISYTFTGTGCIRTTIMTVNALPAPITGIAAVCQAATTTLADATPFGTWSSDASSIASVDASTGIVTGGAAGLAMITYALPTTCIATRQVTVNPLPVLNITPATPATLCQGDSTSFTASSPLIEFPVLSQNFNEPTLGSWTITNLAGNPANVWNLTTTPFSTTTGDGTQMLESAPSGGATSPVHTILTSPGFSTVGFGTAILSFNEYVYSIIDPAELSVAVEYSTNNGTTWSMLLDQIGAVVDPATWTASAPQVSIALPSDAVNVPNVKLRWHYNSYGVSWALDNIYVKGALPAATFTWAGVGAADGLSCTTCPTATITPTVPGANVYSVTANSTCSTTGSVTVNMNPLPNITGPTGPLCTGKTITLGTDIAGGTWVSSDNAKATVNATTGAVSGIDTGSVLITYTSPTGCVRTVTINVNLSPQGITGSLNVCETMTTTLGNSVTGGTWSSTNLSAATIDMLSGVMTGLVAGTTVISYIMPSGCFVKANAIVRPLPAITGYASLLCTGSTIALGATITGGTWASSNNAVATVDASTGVVTGVDAGSVVISYTLPTTCGTAVTLNVNQTPGPVTGALHLCEGLTTALGNAEGGGSWSSSDPGVATIDMVSGLTTAVSAGTTLIDYVLPAGCKVTAIATVDQTPAAFTGSLAVCENSTTSLGTTPTGGTWISGSPAIAVVDVASGVVTGMAHGTANIVYTSAAGCEHTEVVTVNELPADITGSTAVCEGLTTTLVNTTGSGTWSSSNLAVGTVDAGGVVSGLTFGTAMISYTITSTGCYKTTEVTVNALPGMIGGSMVVCEGLSTTLSNTPTGGTWISSNTATATIDLTSGVMTGGAFGTTNITYTLSTGCLRSAEATVNPLPVDITGPLEVCQGLTINLVNTTPDGTWSSDDLSIAGIDATGMVTGNLAGTANIFYTLTATGCLKSVTVTVNPLPSTIGGSLAVCEGLTSSLTNTALDGTWTSSAPLIADVDPASGVMTGFAMGTATITYTLGTGCMKVGEATVNPLPDMITGTAAVCNGLTTTLANATLGGTWSNDASGAATVDAAGVVTGAAAGLSTISYTITSTGCLRAVEVTVNALPEVYAVTGGGGYCLTTAGIAVGLANSETGVNYDLYQGTSLMGSASGTTGSAVSFGLQSLVGTYTVFATNTATGCVNDMAGSAIVSTMPLNIPAVALSTAATTVCSGIPITYTATPVNGGTLPVYSWEINGGLIPGATSATYAYTPNNGDIVKVTLNSNEVCAIPSTATDLLTMTVNTSEMPVATISVPNTTVCAGSGATFSVAPTFGGTTPSYEWFVNGGTTSVTSTVYTYAPSNGDVVTCKMSSNFTCRMADTVVSNSLTITTTPISLPIVSLSVSPSSVFTSGTSVTFSAIVTGVGTVTPSYQWVVNNIVQTGSTGSTFTSSTLHNNDSVTCKVSVSLPCGFENFNSIVVRVKTVGVSQMFGQGNIMLVPNPNQGEFVVKGTLATETDEDVFVEVLDMLGQIVYKGHTVTKNGALNEKIKLSNTLANGMYMLNLRTATEAAVFHFVLEQ